MEALVDDIGSFLLPPYVDRKAFEKAYVLARKAVVANGDMKGARRYE